MRFFIVVLLGGMLSLQAVANSNDTVDLGAELKAAKRLIDNERYSKAIRKLEKVLSSEPASADGWNLLGYAARKEGKLEKSASAYSKALKLDPHHKGALEYQGELFVLLGDKLSAQTNLQKLSALCPSGCEEKADLEKALAKLQ